MAHPGPSRAGAGNAPHQVFVNRVSEVRRVLSTTSDVGHVPQVGVGMPRVWGPQKGTRR